MEDEAVSVFRELAGYPELTSARLCKVDENVIEVESLWNQRCLQKNEFNNFQRNFLISTNTLDVISKSRPQPNGESIWNVPSPSGTKSAIVRRHIADKNKPTDEKFLFEIWSNAGKCVKVLDVSACEKHGLVYGEDGAFGSLSWNSTEDKLSYVAEKKKPKTSSFFNEPKKSSDDTPSPIPGDKFVYREDWGEKLVKKEHPVICVLDLVSAEVTVIEDNLTSVSCGQVVWCPGGKAVVFCGFHHTPIRLGIIHCPIRRSILYHFDLETQKLRPLSDVDGNLSVKTPRFSPDGSKLVYFECTAGGPHCKCLRLMLIDWKTGESRVVVDVVNKCSPDSDDSFHGIYSDYLPTRCWNQESTHVFLSSPTRSTKNVFSINISSGEIIRLTKVAASWGFKDILGDYILASVSKLNSPYRLAIGSIAALKDKASIDWKYLDEESHILGIKFEILQHKPSIPHTVYDSLTYDSIILQPTNLPTKGLIVFPHGGPHSNFSCGYQIYFACLTKLGFTVALVNYRGSTGFGEDSINSLPGFIGDADIKDVQQCAEEVLEKYSLDRERVVTLGGSHGGFITAHLIGQYPTFYKAAVMRNPVTNLLSMVALTDIPDWSHVEAGVEEYIPGKVPTVDVYSTLYSVSPVSRIDVVQTPTMIMLGREDRRVPPSQGVEFHKALISKGVPSRLCVYPDNSHHIGTVEAESDSFINLYKWFVTHLG